MEKIYLIKATNGTIEFNSSVVKSEKLAKAVCLYFNETSDDDYKYSYEELKVIWNNTDLHWLIDKANEATKMKELPF